MANIVAKAYGAVFLGQFGENSHPVHPATVHFPIAFLLLASVLQVTYGLIPYISLLDEKDAVIVALAGHGATILGVVTSIPAVLTGVAELLAMIRGNGLYTKNDKGEKITLPKVITTVTHAALNDLAVGIAVYNWNLQRQTVEYRPASHQIAISAVSLLLVTYAAYLGGGLVYTRGVGVQRMGKGAELKRQAMEEYATEKKGKSK